MIAPLVSMAGGGPEVLVGPETGDDAGVLARGDEALVATVDFITPVCDDPVRFGRVAAANSLSDVYAMGGRPLLALNVCCFPKEVPREILSRVLEGAAGALRESGTALLGGHTVEDRELKFGLCVVGHADPDRLMTNAAARPGERLILTKPLGTGVLINAFKSDRLDAAGLEPVLVEMERLNGTASALALEHGVRAATDVTGFGLVGHALGMARASGVTMRFAFDSLPVHDSFFDLVRRGVTTGATAANRESAGSRFEDRAGLSDERRELLFDPQTSGGLLLAVAPEREYALLSALKDQEHRAALIGEVVEGTAKVIAT